MFRMQCLYLSHLLLALIICHLNGNAQTTHSLTDSIRYRLVMQGTVAKGEYSPLWLNANHYGLSSVEKANGYLRAAIERPLCTDKERKWGLGYGADLAVAVGFSSRVVIQQAYVEGRWLKGVLTIGAKELPMELKNAQLSTGAQTLGINARPVPQVRLALSDYWMIPGLKGWLGLKGHLAYGKMTDGCWQKEFTQQKNYFIEDAFLHTKAGYLKIGPKNLTLEVGLEMATQFGGQTYRKFEEKWQMMPNKSGIGAFWDALIPGGYDTGETDYQNVGGNMLGSWVLRLNFNQPTWNIGLYADRHLDDHSSMLMLDYDGYEPGKLYVKRNNRYLLYDLKDIQLGVELQLKQCDWLNTVVLEYIYTKYQSGPLYHDHTLNVADHIGGIDDFYNHSIFTGWQHWGQVMGNPLYRSPIYNTNGEIYVQNNRFVVWHLGLAGHVMPILSYRLLTTFQTGLGTYERPYTSERRNISILGEVSCRLAGDWELTGSLGIDRGEIFGDNTGVQLTVSKSGIFGK